MSHPVVLVNEEDHSLGTAEKLRAHTQGWLHRAFSVFMFDPQGRLLLQQRTGDKYHSGGLWSNTCCSHPRPGEAPLDAAHRRLSEEMGFTAASLTPVFQKTYNLPVDNDLVEHEHNHVFVGTTQAPTIQPSAEEVSDWAWVHPSTLREDLTNRPDRYTAWFRLLIGPTLDTAPTPPSPTAPPPANP